MEAITDTLNWLYSLEGRGEIYKLERMEQALALLGNPHRKLRAIHIAGTKGKGSVAAILDACLRAGGYRVGLYTKPHLVNLTERTRINGAEMPVELMRSYIVQLRDIFDRAGLALTFFEFTVALMFLYFAEAGLDFAVIETGLGGRLDSTNVVRPLLSVITPIGYDHMDRLGYTIAEIAAEKGGIIKAGVPVVIGTRDPEARATLVALANHRQSSLTMLDREFRYLSHAPKHRLDYHGRELDLLDLELGLAGPFQHENAAIALAAIEELQRQGVQLGEDTIRRGLREVYWPGRFDIVARRPTVILDCAHNELAIAALLESLDVEFGFSGKPHLVFGCLEEKQWERMAQMLAPRVRSAILTRAKPKRPLNPNRLLPVFAEYTDAAIELDPPAAIARAIAQAAPDELVLATGSVYLIGEIYPYFMKGTGRRGLFPEGNA